MSMTLGICEIYNRTIHGFTEQSTPDIDNYFLLNLKIGPEEFFNNDYKYFIEILRENNERFIVLKHPTIRNYNKIIKSNRYYNLEIVKPEELEGGECVAILKTFWLRLFQRKCRKYLNNKYNTKRGDDIVWDEEKW